MDLDRQLASLEDAGQFEAARELRVRAVNSTAPEFSAPLWRSEGWDRLERSHDPQGALAAFKNAIETMSGRPEVCAMTKPQAVYFGAAVAALELGDVSTAETYAQSFRQTLVELGCSESKQPYRDQLEWLRQRMETYEMPSNIAVQPTRAARPSEKPEAARRGPRG